MENKSIVIGKRIAEIRKIRGLTQNELAELTGLDSANLARIEKGRYSTGINLIGRICEALKCEITLDIKS